MARLTHSAHFQYHARMIKVVTDSTCDLPAAIVEQREISVAPMLLEVDGRSYRDGIDISRAEFYTGLPAYKAFPKTAAASPATLMDLYRAAASQGANEIISVHLARKLSAVCAAADIAAAEVAAEGIKVHVVDSGGVSMGLGYQAMLAAQLARNNQPAHVILDGLSALRNRIKMFALADTLKYLRKSGRVSAVVGSIGELLQMRLLVELKDGVVSQLDRARSRRQGLEQMIRHARAAAPAAASQLSVLYTRGEGIEDDIRHVQRQLGDIVAKDKQLVTEVTPIIGAHFGPLAMGVIWG